MKYILFLFLPFLPYLASAQVAKDTVTVLTTAEISALAPQDTGNVYFIHQGSWRKTRFDTIYQYARLKQLGDRGGIDVTGADGLTWTVDTNAVGAISIAAGAVDSTKLAAGAVVLPGAKVTGTLPVTKGGTGTLTQFTEGRVVFAGSNGVYTQDSNLTYKTIAGGVRQLRVENPGFSAVPVFYAKAKVGGITGDNPAGATVFENDGSGGTGMWAISQYYISSGNVTDDPAFTFLGKDAGGSARTVILLGADITSLADGAPVADFVIWNANGGNPSELYRFQADGDFGIGTANPSEKLHVVGNARITAMNGINDIGASATGVLQAATSDYNLKNSIEDSGFGLNHILQLRPVTFLYNDQDRKIHSEIPEVGFIAQDVNDVIPNAVSPTGEGTLQLDYRAITATLVKAMQEQQVQIQALQQRIIQLENK